MYDLLTGIHRKHSVEREAFMITRQAQCAFIQQISIGGPHPLHCQLRLHLVARTESHERLDVSLNTLALIRRTLRLCDWHGLLLDLINLIIYVELFQLLEHRVGWVPRIKITFRAVSIISQGAEKWSCIAQFVFALLSFHQGRYQHADLVRGTGISKCVLFGRRGIHLLIIMRNHGFVFLCYLQGLLLL